MNANYEMLKYILKHKLLVAKFGKILAVPMHLRILHDWTKFTPAEWTPYVNYFRNPDGTPKKGARDAETRRAFDIAWLSHQHNNKHHWQYWLLQNDQDGFYALEMPAVYVREMVADWAGAGVAITGRFELAEWYAENSGKIILHPGTRALVNAYIEYLYKTIAERPDFWVGIL